MKAIIFIFIAAAVALAVAYAIRRYKAAERAKLEKHLAYAKLGEPHAPTEGAADEFELWQCRAERLSRNTPNKDLDRLYKRTKSRITALENKLDRPHAINDEQPPLVPFREMKSLSAKARWVSARYGRELPLSEQLAAERDLYECRIWKDVIEEIVETRTGSGVL